MNVVAAVVLGPWWAVVIAAVIGVIRNVMGVGTVLAFPGGIFTAAHCRWHAHVGSFCAIVYS